MFSAHLPKAVGVLYALAAGSVIPAAGATSDAQALRLLASANSALSAASPISDVILSGTVNYTAGSDEESGQTVLKAKGGFASRITLALSGGQREEIRLNGAGAWSTDNRQRHTMTPHNCLVPAAWFFPHLLIAAALQDSSYSAAYAGSEQRGGSAVEHIRITRTPPGFQTSDDISQLSTADLYLDPATFLPVALAFQQHPDENAITNLAVEIDFSDYRRAGTAQVAYHAVKLLQNTVLLDLTISDVRLNSGLPDSDFALQ